MIELKNCPFCGMPFHSESSDGYTLYKCGLEYNNALGISRYDNSACEKIKALQKKLEELRKRGERVLALKIVEGCIADASYNLGCKDTIQECQHILRGEKP